MKVGEKLEWSYGVNNHWILDVFRVILGLYLLFAGIGHLTF